MKVLFVSSGNNKTGISPIVQAQGESLAREGIGIQYFRIIGKGLSGYLAGIFKLRRFLKDNSFDIIHSHYSLSAFVASLAGARPHVVSLMGSDLKAKAWNKWFIWVFCKISWDACIVKSEEMRNTSGLKHAMVIPNGVDLDVFKPLDKEFARKQLGMDGKKKIIVFAADPRRYEKNFSLATDAVKLIRYPEVELKVVAGVAHSQMSLYLNAADLLLLTSRWEGSPNVIKEAMACNCPIVSTPVGDVKWLINGTEGCYLTSFEAKNVADKIAEALLSDRRTNGRNRIMELGLDSMSVLGKISQVYTKILAKP